MDSNKKFTEDQKAVTEREIKGAYGALSMLLELVQKDNLNDEMKETLPNLIESRLNTIKEVIGFTGEETESVKEMHQSLVQYQQKQIEDLKKALSNQNSIESISATVKMALDKIDKWWDIEGFEYIREKSITANGNISLKFGIMLDSFTSQYSTTPVTNKHNLQTKVQYLIDKGFQFTPKKRGYELDLIDNDKNRALVIELIKNAFPSARISEFKNYLRRTNNEKDDYFVLKEIDVMIYDLSDVENLEIQEKFFLLDEDED
ncbi:hypothetical protein ABD87_14630 [Lysinibacillus sphaericus]|uniref:hypothetical protein n=1 Tax=Lysinibacillus sphaericus TaxID=1421 RepID=UPI0018CCF194|nr:hypothetical protein [Lysinibacillus sphaericus]MBG9730736.1 hypothetical protein [Lysinibacillus sphaericus]